MLNRICRCAAVPPRVVVAYRVKVAHEWGEEVGRGGPAGGEPAPLQAPPPNGRFLVLIL